MWGSGSSSLTSGKDIDIRQSGQCPMDTDMVVLDMVDTDMADTDMVDTGISFTFHTFIV